MIKLTLLMLLLAAYIYLRVVRPLRWPVWGQAVVWVCMLFPALRYVILRQFGGMAMAPLAPAWFLYGSAVVFVAFLMYFCGALGGNVLQGLALRWVASWQRLGAEAQQRVFNRAHLLLLPVALLLSSVGVYSGLLQPELREVRLEFPAATELRMAVIADMHVCSARSPEYMQRIVQRVNDQHPDIVLLVGDFADGSPEECGEKLAPLRELCAPLGVYAVTGNHEYYSGYKRWRPVLCGFGIRMLDNAHVVLREQGIVLAGVTDESAAFEHMEGPDLEKALRGAPAELPVLLMAHRPIVARESAPAGVSLQVSGHLHGGLVWGLGLLVAAVDAGYRAGLYRVGDMQLYVTAGAGCSARTPLRLGVPPEISLITLVPKG